MNEASNGTVQRPIDEPAQVDVPPASEMIPPDLRISETDETYHVDVGVRYKLLSFLASVFFWKRRGETLREANLRHRVNRLIRTLDDREERIRRLRYEVAELRESGKIKDAAIEGLTRVIARDHKRVEAETARYAQQIAQTLNLGSEQ